MRDIDPENSLNGKMKRFRELLDQHRLFKQKKADPEDAEKERQYLESLVETPEEKSNVRWINDKDERN